MKHLAEAGGEIAVPGEILRQRNAVACALHIPDARRQPVNAGGGRPQSRQQAGARGIAQRRLAMSIAEERAARGQAIQVRCLRLGMSSQAADPVIQVVNGDEEDVRPFRGCRTNRVVCQSQRENGEDNPSRELPCHGRSREPRAIPLAAPPVANPATPARHPAACG